jgi:hypothetical protein
MGETMDWDFGESWFSGREYKGEFSQERTVAGPCLTVDGLLTNEFYRIYIYIYIWKSQKNVEYNTSNMYESVFLEKK